MNLRLPLIIALLLPSIAPLPAQRLSDVILSLDDRQHMVDQRWEAASALRNALKAAGETLPAPVPIDWHHVGANPAATMIDQAPAADRIALLNQAAGLFPEIASRYLNLSAAEALGSSVGCLRGFMPGDFPALPRADERNYQGVLRQLAWQIRQLRVFPWVFGANEAATSKILKGSQKLEGQVGHEQITGPHYPGPEVSAAITEWMPETLDLEDGSTEDPEWSIGSVATELGGVTGTVQKTVDSAIPITSSGVHDLNCTTSLTRAVSVRLMAHGGGAGAVGGTLRLLARNAWSPLAGVTRPSGLGDPADSAWQVLGGAVNDGTVTPAVGEGVLEVTGTWVRTAQGATGTATTTTYSFVENGYIHKAASLLDPPSPDAWEFAASHISQASVLKRELRAVFVPAFGRGLDAAAMTPGLANSFAISPASGADGSVMLHPHPAALFGIDLGPGLSGAGSGMIGVAPGIGSEMAWWGTGLSDDGGGMFALHAPPEDGGRFGHASRLCFFGPGADYHVVHATARTTAVRGAPLPAFGRPVTGGYDTASMLRAWDAPRLRQVVGRDLIADITYQGHYQCEVSIYRRAPGASSSFISGVPVTVSGTPLRTWVIGNPDATTDTQYLTTPEHLEINSGDVTHTVERSALVSQGETLTFRTTEGTGENPPERYKKTIANGTPADPHGTNRTVSEWLDGTPVGSLTLPPGWQWFSGRWYGSGETLTTTWAAGTRTTTATATFDPPNAITPGSQGRRFPRTLSIADSALGDTTFLIWDANGILTDAHAQNDKWSRATTASGNTLTTTTAYDDATVATAWTEFTGPASIKHHSAPDGLVTSASHPAVAWEEIQYGDAATGTPGLLHRITRNDGTATLCDWSASAAGFTLTVKNGQLTGDTLTRGTETTTTYNASGYQESSTTTLKINSVELQISGSAAAAENGWGAPLTVIDFATGRTTTYAWDGDFPRLASVTDPLGLTTGITARDALDRPIAFIWDGATGSITRTATSLNTSINLGTGPGATLLTTHRAWDDQGRPTADNLTRAGVTSTTGIAYSGPTATITRGNDLTGATATTTLNTLTGASTTTGTVLPFGGLTAETIAVENGLIVTKTLVTGRTADYQTIWTDARGRVRKTSVPSTSGGGADETLYSYADPGPIARLTVTEPSGRLTLIESAPFDPAGITTRSGLDTDKDGLLNGADRYAETLTTIPDYPNKSSTVSSSAGWTHATTVNHLGLPTDSTLSGTGIPTTTLAAAWRADGTLATVSLAAGEPDLDPETPDSRTTTTANYAPTGLLTGLTVPNETGFFGGHFFDIPAKTENLILGGVKTTKSIDGTSVSLTKDSAATGGAVPNLTPATRTLAKAGTDLKHIIAPASGAPTQITLNDAGVPVKHGYAAGFSPETTWLPGGRPAALTCARGGAIAFGWSTDPNDGARDLLSITYPPAADGHGGLTPYATHSFTYFPSGKIHTIADASGKRALAYRKGRLHTVTATGTPIGGYQLTRAHDASGRLQTLTLTRGGETLLTRATAYNGASGEPQDITAPGFSATYARISPDTRALTKITRGPLVQTWTRAAAGRIAGSTAAGLAYTHGAWDDRSRRLNMTTPAGSWTYDYNSNGQIEKATRGNTVLNYDWDAIGRRNFDNQANVLNQFTDLANPDTKNLLITADPAAKLSINGQPMTPFSGGWLHPLANPDTTNGAWVPWTVKGVIEGGGEAGAAADATSILSGHTWLPPVDETITYDESGNRRSTALWTYRWNSRNQLVTAATKNIAGSPEGWQIHFDYDAEGRRFKKQVIHKTTADGAASTTTVENIYFIWDGWNLIYERHENQYGMRLWDRQYIWGEDLAGGTDGAEGCGGAGALLLIRDHRNLADPAAYTDYYPCYDTSGHVIALTDPAGAVVATYDYGPFGEQLAAAGPAAAGNPFRYATKYFDVETGLYYFGRRYYDPATAQWLSREPLGEAESLNLYSYCHNDPVNRVDALGLASIIINSQVANASIGSKKGEPLPGDGSLGVVAYGYSLDDMARLADEVMLNEADWIAYLRRNEAESMAISMKPPQTFQPQPLNLRQGFRDMAKGFDSYLGLAPYDPGRSTVGVIAPNFGIAEPNFGVHESGYQPMTAESLTSGLLNGIPVIGTFKGFIEISSGYDILSGRRVGQGEAAFNVMLSAWFAGGASVGRWSGGALGGLRAGALAEGRSFVGTAAQPWVGKGGTQLEFSFVKNLENPKFVLYKASEFNPSMLRPGEYTLNLPYLRNEPLDWAQNQQALERAMNIGIPIREVNPNALGGWLQRERDFLGSGGWQRTQQGDDVFWVKPSYQ